MGLGCYVTLFMTPEIRSGSRISAAVGVSERPVAIDEKQLEDVLNKLPPHVPLLWELLMQFPDYPKNPITHLEHRIMGEEISFLVNLADFQTFLTVMRQFLLCRWFTNEQQVRQILERAPLLSIYLFNLHLSQNHPFYNDITRRIESTFSELTETLLPQERMRAFHRLIDELDERQLIIGFLQALQRLEGGPFLHEPCRQENLWRGLIRSQTTIDRNEMQTLMVYIIKMREQVKELVQCPTLPLCPFESDFDFLLFSYICSLCFPDAPQSCQTALLPLIQKLSPTIRSILDSTQIYATLVQSLSQSGF